MDIIALAKAIKVSKAYTDEVAKALAGGLHYKGSVADKTKLPLSGNKLGDMYTTNDDGHEHVWTKDAASGTAEDWLDLNKELENFYKKAEVDALLANKLNVLPKVDDPTDPGFGWEYHIPYNFEATPDSEKLNIKLKTLTLDNKVTKMDFDKSLPGATTTTAGLMTAADKVALNGKQDTLTAGENITIEDNVISAQSGLPEGTSSGEIIIFDGEEWKTQEGYGFTKYEVTLTFTWDGTPCETKIDTSSGEMHKIANPSILPTYENVVPTKCTYLDGGNEYTIKWKDATLYMMGTNTLFGQCGDLFMVVVYQDGTKISFFDNKEFSKGIWFNKKNTNTYITSTESASPVVTKIDSKLIINTIEVTGDSGTFTDAQLSLLENKVTYIVRNSIKFGLSSTVMGKGGQLISTYVSTVGTDSDYILVNIFGKSWTYVGVDLQPKLTAGENITIENNVISATGGTSVEFDDKTITKGTDNKYQTTIGGWKENTPEQITNLFIDSKGDGSPTYLGPSSSSIKYDVGWDYNPTITSLVSGATKATIQAKFTVLGTTFNGSVTLTKSVSIPANWESDYLTIGGNQYKIKIGDGWVGVGNGGISLIGNPSLDISTSTMESCGLITAPASTTYHPIDSKFIDIDNSTIKLNGNTLYSVGGTTVEANVPITGDEDELISLKVGNTVYQNLNYHPFPDAFVVNKTLKEFGQSIVGYTGFATGCVWYGGIQCTDLPGKMVQVECKVTAIRDTVDFVRNIAIVEIYSSEVAPFYWHYNTDSWNEGTGLDDWKYVASIDESKFDSTAAVNDSYNVMVRKVSAAAGSTGWEFYPEKPGSTVLDGNNVGVIVPFGGNSIPVGYLECNGAAISRTTYSELFNVIGTTYGSGDGSTTFNLPNLQEKFVEGSSSSLAVGTVKAAGLPNITGKFSVTCDEDYATHDVQSPIALCHNNYAGAFTGSHTNKAIRNIGGVYDRRGESNYDNEVNFDASTANSIYGNSTTVQPNAVVTKYIIKYTKTLGATSEPDNTNIKYDSNGKLTLSKILQSGTHITIDSNNKIQLNNAISVGSIAASDVISLSTGGRLALEDNDFSGVENAKGNLQDVLDAKTKVSVSASGSSTSEVKYITVNDTEYKIATGESELPEYPTDTTHDYTLAITYSDGKWVKYWKALPSTSNVVGIGQVDYMTL